MKVLAIESTADETAVALVENLGDGVKVIKSVVASSLEMHRKYGGIVPEVAAREHIKNIIPLISEVVESSPKIDAVAVSYGPGLMGGLLIGVETAKVLAWVWKTKLLKVNHMTGHVLANWIVEDKNDQVPQFPALGLIVSGGHTDMILMKDLNNWAWIGGTRDDAAGEAFDKVARLLDLPYPGGPEIDKASQKLTDEQWGELKKNYKLPRPLLNEAGLEMSFSGLKAAVSRLVEEKKDMPDTEVRVIAREFSEAVAEILIKKTLQAIEIYSPKSVILAGGVAANKNLREKLKESVEKIEGITFFNPQLKYCGDNAAMIGATAIMRPEEAGFDLKPEPSLAVV